MATSIPVAVSMAVWTIPKKLEKRLKRSVNLRMKFWSLQIEKEQIPNIKLLRGDEIESIHGKKE